MKFTSCVLPLAFGILLTACACYVSIYHYYIPWYETTTIYDQNGNQVTSNYESDSYVVPTSQNSRGTYYTNNNVRYYHDHDHGHGE